MGNKKRTMIIAAFLICAAGIGLASAESKGKSTILSLNPLGLLSGFIGGTLETRVTDTLSIYLYPAYYTDALTIYNAIIPTVDFWSVTGALGVNIFLNKKAPLGQYFGIGIIGGYINVSDATRSINSAVLGLEIRFGYRFAWNCFTLSPNASVRGSRTFAQDSQLKRVTYRVIHSLRYRLGLGPGIIF